MDKNNFLLYKDFKSTIDLLSDEQAGKLIKAVFSYVNGRVEPVFDDGMLVVAFNILKTQLERDLQKYKEKAEQNRINGKKGGRPKDDDLITITGKKVPREIKKGHFIYIMYDKVQDEYKIGETQNLFQRRYDIKRPTNDLYIYDFEISTANVCQKLERQIIEEFKDYRISGDWFYFNDNQITQVVNMIYEKTHSVSNIPKKADRDSVSVRDSVSDSDKKDNIKPLSNWEKLFDKFWLDYPKKVNKGNAKKWFKQNKPNELLVNIMIEKVLEYIEKDVWNKENYQYIPYASSWLNAEGWTNEVIKVDKNNKQYKNEQQQQKDELLKFMTQKKHKEIN